MLWVCFYSLKTSLTNSYNLGINADYESLPPQASLSSN